MAKPASVLDNAENFKKFEDNMDLGDAFMDDVHRGTMMLIKYHSIKESEMHDEVTLSKLDLQRMYAAYIYQKFQASLKEARDV